MIAANPKLVGKSLALLLEGLGVAQPIPDIIILDIVNSSRQVAAGSLFVALQGGTTHGIDFAIDAVKAGAVGVMYRAQDGYSKNKIDVRRTQIETQWIGDDKLDQVNGENVSLTIIHI